ncbi:MAG: EF-hand domain-containing protein [Pseudomonadota bacterium]
MSISGVSSGSSYQYSLQTRSLSSSDQTDMAKKMASQMIEALDSDSDGSLSATEIGVDQTTLSQADTDGDGVLSDSELISLMNTMGPPPMGAMNMAQNSESASASGGGAPDSSEMFDSLDTNQDGIVSQEEFLAGRPDDVSQEQAQNMWSKLDSEGTGGLSQSQFEEAMQNMGPPPGPPPGGGGGGATSASSSSSSTSDTSTASSTSTSQSLSELLAALLANYGKSQYQQALSTDLTSLLSSGSSQGSSSLSVTA